MIQRYRFLDEKDALPLLERIGDMTPEKHGVDGQVYLIGEYAVVHTNRLKLRNVVFRDDGLVFFDDVIDRLARLYGEGVQAMPILGYCYDPGSADGEGYIIQRRAKGEELYDDALLCRFEEWTQDEEENQPPIGAAVKDYLLERTRFVSDIPQAHFDRFVHDIRAILGREILIDFQGKSNFFYHEAEGFQFIDLNAHVDSFYDAQIERADVDAWTAVGSFVPCHFAPGTEAFAPTALADRAMQAFDEAQRERLAQDNLRIFEKCLTALHRSGVAEGSIETALGRIKIYGQ